MPLTRRDLLNRIAAAGGASLVYDAMTGLGLLEAQTRAPFDLQGQVDGVRVVVIGAGLAGLTAAYELTSSDTSPGAGGAARGRAAACTRSGAARSARRTAAADRCVRDGLYFNCGAMRIPYHHATSLHYCRELQVPVEVFAVTSEARISFNRRPRPSAASGCGSARRAPISTATSPSF